MKDNMIALPYWLFSLLIAITLFSVLDRLLIPSIRWYFRRKIKKMVDNLNDHLSIKLQPFKTTKRQSLIDRLLCDPQVLETANEVSDDEEITLQEAISRVELYAKEIVPSFNVYFYFQIGYWLARKLSEMMYRVRLGFMDEESLGRVDLNSSVVFVMNHRSNMDYVLVSYFVASKTAISYAVGEWARIWPLQSLIKFMGGFFVRRKAGNKLYRKVLERYIQMSADAGVTQAIFLEGHLTRDGTLCPPRLGLLDYLLRNYDPKNDREIYFVPVGINYDRTLEDRTQLLPRGERNDAKTLFSTLKTISGFLFNSLILRIQGKWHRFGYACLSFGTPVSIIDYMKEKELLFSDLDKTERFQKIEQFAVHLMEKIGESVPILPVSLISNVMIETKDQWMTELELKVAVLEKMEFLRARGGRIYIPRKDMDYAIEVGLRMLRLRHFIEEKEGLFKIKKEEEKVVRYYANSIEHYFNPGLIQIPKLKIQP
ncbi:MAG: glycerol-3-phosphate acyltransferase [Proteobacteria bacterium]|nr:glycerol-3-phosphate acyltransferase [Pseudomonadota bacterium]